MMAQNEGLLKQADAIDVCLYKLVNPDQKDSPNWRKDTRHRGSQKFRDRNHSMILAK
jgi:hypothetical protein